MKTKNTTKTTGAYAPQKEHVFSLNVVEKGVRVEYINSVPQEEMRNATSREVGRRRIRAD
jgi:hypothetical protein